jgi:putative SOS response-associated peptidase YedK
LPAAQNLSRITDRMPAILPRETWATWLGETDTSPADAKTVLQTFEDSGAWVMVGRLPKPNPLSAQGSLF